MLKGSIMESKLDNDIDLAVHNHMSRLGKLGARALWRNLAERAQKENAKRNKKVRRTE